MRTTWVLVCIALFGMGLFAGRVLPGRPRVLAAEVGAQVRTNNPGSTSPSPKAETQEGALARALQAVKTSVLMEPQQRESHLAAALDEVTLQELPAVVAAIEAVPFADVRADQMAVLLRHWGRLDGPAAMAFAEGMAANQRELGRAAALTGWSQAEPWAAAEWVEQLPPGSRKWDLLPIALDGLAGEPERALTWLQQVDPAGKAAHVAHSFFASWTSREPSAAAAAASALPPGRLRTQALSSVAWRWGESDPQAALSWVYNLPAGQQRSLIGRVLVSWASRDAAAAAEAAMALKDLQLREESLQLISTHWAEQDPASAAAWAQRVADPELRHQFIQGMFHFWAAESPREALNYLQGLPENGQKRQLYRTFAEGWSRSDPEAAAQWVASLPGGVLRNDLAEHLATTLSYSDPAQALKLFQQLPAGPRRQVLVSQVLGSLAAEDLPRAVQILGTLTEAERRVGELAVINSQLENDPASAAALSERLGTTSPTVAQRIAEVWSARDLEATRTWVTRLPSETREAALLGMSSAWARQDPSGLSRFAGTLPEGPARSELLREAGQSLARRGDSSALITWYQQLAAGESRQAALAGAVSALAENSPSAAAALVASLPRGEEQTIAAVEVASRWAEQEPRMAATWVLQFPEGELREEAMRTILNTWAYNEPSQAADFLAALPPGISRDAASMGFINVIAEHNPALAAPYVAGISDQQRRVAAVDQVVRNWMNISPPQAQAWLKTAPILEESKNALLEDIAADSMAGSPVLPPPPPLILRY